MRIYLLMLILVVGFNATADITNVIKSGHQVSNSGKQLGEALHSITEGDSDLLEVEDAVEKLKKKTRDFEIIYFDTLSTFTPLAKIWKVSGLKCRNPNGSDYETWTIRSGGITSTDSGVNGTVEYRPENQAVIVKLPGSAGNFTKRIGWIHPDYFRIKFSASCILRFYR